MWELVHCHTDGAPLAPNPVMAPDAVPTRGRGGATLDLPWRFGGFLATSLLSRDPLGSVFRALPLDEKPGGFVRLRTFDRSELSPGRMAEVFLRLREKPPLAASPVLAENARVGLQDGTAWLAWNESHGHALDLVLAQPSSEGARLPPEHALLIADRLALALEHASRAGRFPSHGLLWPGWVILGPAGDVRVGGFGIAPAVLASVAAPGIAAEIAPYLAPETREGQAGGPVADVYSVAAVLLHLLTGTRPPLQADTDAMGPAGLLPPGVAELLRAALAPASRRTPSAGRLRREIGSVLVSAGLQPSSRALASFLASRMESAISGVRFVAPSIGPSASEDEAWELAVARLELRAERAATVVRPRPRAVQPARVPLPPGVRDSRSPRDPSRHLRPR